MQASQTIMAVYSVPSEMREPTFGTYFEPSVEACHTCGTASSFDQFCHSCASPVCKICIADGETLCLLCNFQLGQQMQNVENLQSDYQFQDEEQFQSEFKTQMEETCGNCCATSMCATRCQSCSGTVCSLCMAQEEGCCLECLKTFPESPTSAMGGGSLIDWLTALADSEDASPKNLPQKQRIDLNDCLTVSACEAYAISCVGPTRVERISGSASESTALSWADASDSEGSIASPEPATTMMICNIPCRFGQADVVEAIHSVGFGGTYDFVYLPSRSGKHNANIGYAFVDFKSARNAEGFAEAFDNFRFPGTKSSKACTVKHAHQQGFNAAPSRRSKRA